MLISFVETRILTIRMQFNVSDKGLKTDLKRLQVQTDYSACRITCCVNNQCLSYREDNVTERTIKNHHKYCKTLEGKGAYEGPIQLTITYLLHYLHKTNHHLLPFLLHEILKETSRHISQQTLMWITRDKISYNLFVHINDT